MSAQTIQMAIWASLAATASVIGFAYRHYRPQGPDDPIAGAPPMPDLLVAASVRYGAFDTAPSPGKPERFLYVDATQTQAGDYLIGGPLGTLAVLSQDPMAPVLGLACNHVVTFKRPGAVATLGAQGGYGGDVATLETPLLMNWPAYLGSAGSGRPGPAHLPGEVDTPRVEIRLPAWPGVVLLNGDVAFDEQGRRYKVISAEATSLGWRISAVLSMA